MYVLVRTINSLWKRPNNHQKHHQNHLQNLIITHHILRFSGYSRMLGIHLFLTKSSTLLSKTNRPHQTLMKRKPKQLHSITCSTNWPWWGGVVPSYFLHHNWNSSTWKYLSSPWIPQSHHFQMINPKKCTENEWWSILYLSRFHLRKVFWIPDFPYFHAKEFTHN